MANNITSLDDVFANTTSYDTFTNLSSIEKKTNLSSFETFTNLTSFQTCANMTSFGAYFLHCTREYEYVRVLKLYGLPLFVVLGALGNPLALVVIMREKVAQSAITWYTAALMLAQLLVLLTGCGLEWVAYISHTSHVAHRADWACKLFHFTFQVIRNSGCWLLVALTMTCCAQLWCPTRAKQLSSVFVAKFISIALCVWLVSIHVHALWTYEYLRGVCHLDIERQDFQTVVWPWISAVFSNYLPIVLETGALGAILCGCLRPSYRDRVRRHIHTVRLTIVLAVFFLLHAIPTITMNLVDQASPAWQHSTQLADLALRARYFLVQVVFSSLESLCSSVSCVAVLVLLPAAREELVRIAHRLCGSNTHVTVPQHDTLDEISSKRTQDSTV